MIKIFSIILLLLISLQAKNLHKEKVYQEHFCKKFGGITEYRLEDKTRVDCLIQTHAIEVDFAKKWAESIGQSLYYASKTARKPAVLLIMEDEKRDQKYLDRLEHVSKTHNIDIWIINKDFKIIQR
ncbi:MAG: hypothetical protein COA44_09330 [Arcobacter sp.]|nr:MAG: hypothetical protein COA44_09330 [Arcobacter sp.]